MDCTIGKTTFTGAQFIAALGGQLTSVGSFDAAAIDNDIAINGDLSQVGIAASLLNRWISHCNVSTNMVQSICDTLRQGFKFFVLYQYSVLFVNTQKTCGCDCQNDIVMQDFLKDQACRFFAQISLCLKKCFIDYTNIDCVETIQTKFDFSAFGVSMVVDNCIYETPPPCDSCGC